MGLPVRVATVDVVCVNDLLGVSIGKSGSSCSVSRTGGHVGRIAVLGTNQDFLRTDFSVNFTNHTTVPGAKSVETHTDATTKLRCYQNHFLASMSSWMASSIVVFRT